MKKLPAKANYDFESDIFSALPLIREYDSSFQKEDIILDLDKNGKIVGLELLNASKNFGIPKIFMKNLISIHMQINVSEELIKIQIQIKSLVRNAERISSLNFERIKPGFVNPSELNLAVI
ncbi:MAG: DUF2283 domain-containing protein [Candidatus Woesearchaeota archaeon]